MSSFFGDEDIFGRRRVLPGPGFQVCQGKEVLHRDREVSPTGLDVPVARGPVPRARWSARAMARDRPSPYGEGGVFFRSAGACPPRAPSSRCVFPSVVCDRLITNGSGSGDPDLQGLARAMARACPSPYGEGGFLPRPREARRPIASRPGGLSYWGGT